MPNSLFTITKTSLLTDNVVTDVSTGVVFAPPSGTVLLTSIVVANKSADNARGDVYLDSAVDDSTFFIKNALIGSGNSLQLLKKSKVVMAANETLRARSDTNAALDITIVMVILGYEPPPPPILG